MEYAKTHIRQVVATLVLAVGVLLAFWVFIQDNTARIANQNEEYLAELTTQRAASVDNLLSENLTFIESTAYLYGKSLTSAFADVAIIREYEENSAFDMLRFVDASGDNYTSRGVQANLSDRPYFQAGMRGEVGITYVLQSRVTGEKQIGFYAPVYFEDDIIGVMVGFYGEEYVQKLLEYGLFGYGGQGWLCTADGTVLGTTLDPEPDNFLDYLADGRCEPGELLNIRSAFQDARDISFTYQADGQAAAGYAVALSQVDWMLIRNFPPSASGQILQNANREGIILLLELLGMFAAYGVFMGVGVVLDRRREREANRNANDISAGTSTLFSAFVVLDLQEKTYRYIGGTPGDAQLPLEGPYEGYRTSLLNRIPEQELRDETAPLLDLDRLQRALATADSVNMRVHAPAPHLGIEWLTYSFIVIERADDGGAKRLLAVCQDVTELHHREQAEQERLQHALDTAESASRAKTEFLFNMSHDLRTPMNAIIGYTELAQRDDVSPQQMRDFIGKIDSSSVHLLSLINDILEMSRIESGKMTLAPERCDVVAVLDEAQAMFATQMDGKGIAFTADARDVEDRWVLCDEARVNRVLLNLLSNAYKFTGEGGSVSVRLAQTGRRDGLDGPVGSYELHVKDSGIGMSPDFATRLFSPFERERTSTVSKTQGTGLGLSITKSIVDLMGGTIEVETEQGKGTEFTVRLEFPILEPEEAPQAQEPERAEAVDFTGRHLLVAEDNPINLEIASMILQQAGFQLDTAENGQVAVEKLQAAGPGAFDAVLMDIQMPVMDGYAATRAIRALPDADLAGIPVVAMTANAFAEDVQAALDAGMNAHIAKPLDVPKMMATLAEVLRG